MKVRCPYCTARIETSNMSGKHTCENCNKCFSYYASILLNRFIAEKEILSATTLRRKLLWHNFGGKCHYCRKNIPFEKSTIDHVIPLSHHGRDAKHNMVVACSNCNSHKQSESYETFVCQERRVVYRQYPPVLEYVKYKLSTLTAIMMCFLVGLTYGRYK